MGTETGSAIPPRILLVEDEPMIAEMLLIFLEDAGFSPVWKASAEDALAMLDEDAVPHGVITDIHLGNGRPGWDVAKRARERDPSIPVVFITGDSGHQWHSHGVPLSVIFTKPFFPKTVVSGLEQLLLDRLKR